MELDFLEFEDKELEDFLNKFTLNNLDKFNLILHFSKFGSNKDLVERLNNIKEKISKKKVYDYTKTSIEKSITLLNEKELYLMTGLLDESFACAQCDGRYIEEADYLEYLNLIAEKELVKHIHNKQKVIVKKKSTP